MKDRTRHFNNVLKLCMICNRVWEEVFIDKRNTNKVGISYYDDFPSYGKKKESCPQCLDQDDEYDKGEIK